MKRVADYERLPPWWTAFVIWEDGGTYWQIDLQASNLVVWKGPFLTNHHSTNASGGPARFLVTGLAPEDPVLVARPPMRELLDWFEQCRLAWSPDLAACLRRLS